MDAVKNFFDFKMRTCCGFPSITLEGTDQDWQTLRKNTKSLIENRCTKDMSTWWLASLMPLLDKICNERDNIKNSKTVDSEFWNNMIKRGSTGGSGSITWFSGWINILFPFLDKGEKNEFTVPYDPKLILENEKDITFDC